MALGELLEKIAAEQKEKKNYTISLTKKTADEVKEKVGKGNFSKLIDLLLEKELKGEENGRKK